MAKLNERTEKTKKTIHLLTTSLCKRNCKYCCNKQYDLNSIPYVTGDELAEAETICLTGGEPFLFSNPSSTALEFKSKFENIKQVYVYTNAYELNWYLGEFSGPRPFAGIDGLSISIKNLIDATVFKKALATNEDIKRLPSNRLYIFEDSEDKEHFSGLKELAEENGFTVVSRYWQEDFVPADDSIFRKI